MWCPASRPPSRSCARRAGRVVALASLAVLSAAAPASADVLRLQPLPGSNRAEHATATVLGTDGSRRSLGELQIAGAAEANAADLSPSPDGAVVAVTTYGSGEIYADRSIDLVPTAGGPRRTLRVDGRTRLKVQGEPVWSIDGRELVLGGVRPVLPSRDGHRRLGAYRVVRCDAATGRCRNVAGTGSRVAGPLPDGRVAGVPVTWPARERRTPCGWRLFLIEDSTGSLFSPGGRCDRFLRSFLSQPVTLDASVFAQDGTATRALTWTASLRRGVPRAVTAVASSAGVLIERETVGLRRIGPKAHPGLESPLRTAPAVLVSPAGTARTVAAPHLTSPNGRARQVAPMYALPDGSWLGSVGGQDGGREAEVLTITAPGGRSRAVRVAGQDATPYAVAHAAGTALRPDDVDMSLAGYEHATDSAIVVVTPLARATALATRGCPGAGRCPGSTAADEADDPPPGALVRVPLDGRPPVAIEPVADEDAAAYAAW